MSKRIPMERLLTPAAIAALREEAARLESARDFEAAAYYRRQADKRESMMLAAKGKDS